MKNKKREKGQRIIERERERARERERERRIRREREREWNAKCTHKHPT
jgi:hypothetical protein